MKGGFVDEWKKESCLLQNIYQIRIENLDDVEILIRLSA